MASSGTEESQKCREQGNALYKSGQPRQAIQSYERASQLSPEDYLPLSNLSAVYFELGEYDRCIEISNKGLELASNHPDAPTSVLSKILARLLKVYLHTHQYEQARDLLQRFKDSAPDQKLYNAAISHGIATRTAFPDGKAARKKLDKQVPRYRPALSSNREYYNFGHDEYTPLLEMNEDGTNDICDYFFGGIGDARHLYGTLVMSLCYARIQRNRGIDVSQKYHFTLNDIKPTVHARNLVIFCLLDDLANSAESPLASRLDQLAVIYYIFAAPLMPRFAFDSLHKTIDMLIQKLGAKQPLPSWIKLYEADRPAIIQALKAWRSKALLDYTSPRELIKNTTMQLQMSLHGLPGDHDRPVPPGCDKEWDDYFKTLLLVPPQTSLQKHDPTLRGLISSGASHTSLTKHLEENWSVNTSLLDVDWNIKAHKELDVAHNPFELGLKIDFAAKIMKISNPKKLFDYVRPFFEATATAIRELRGQFTVELMGGDCAATMDAIRHDLVEARDPAAPRSFDCVHLSNVPDYVGGTFNNFVYGTKILKNHKSATIRSTCLRNTATWKSMEHFNCEYMLVSDPKTLFQLTQAHQPKPDTPILPSLPEFALSEYKIWKREATHPFEAELRAPRETVTRWLFAHFFKMAAPAARKEGIPFIYFVYSPLNMTNFLRLLIHLHEIGYPPHWLADVLSKILDNDVTTTARPPKARPIDTAEVTRANPPARLSTAAYVAELSTLTSIFLRLLPFTPITASPLPAPSSIYSYSLKTTMATGMDADLPCQALLFFRFDMMNSAGGTWSSVIEDLGDVLHPLPPTSLDTPKAREFRDKGCFLITTLTCDALEGDEGTFRFWMRQDVMDEVNDNPEWRCALWNIETRTIGSVPTRTDDIARGKRWSS